MKTRGRNYVASAVFMVVGIVLMTWLVSWVATGFDLSDTAVTLIAVFGGLVVAVCTVVLFYELEDRRSKVEAHRALDELENRERPYTGGW